MNVYTSSIKMSIVKEDSTMHLEVSVGP